MKHCECANFLHLDCEKGMCALSKCMVPIDGEGSDACPRFQQGFMCQFCKHFSDADKYGIGTCIRSVRRFQLREVRESLIKR